MVVYSGKTEAGSSLSATEWESKTKLSKFKKTTFSIQTSSYYSVTWRGQVRCSLKSLLTLVFPKFEGKWVLIYVSGSEWWYWWYHGDFLFITMRSEHQNSLLTQGSLELCFMAWGWPYRVATKGQRSLFWKARSSAGPADWPRPCHSLILYQSHYFPSHALQRRDFPWWLQPLQWQRIMFAMAFQEDFRLEVTTIYGLRSHRQLTFCI